MGGDGGTYATKRAYIRGAKSDEKDESKSIRQQQLLRTRICTQSGENLQEPISCCELGNLYNSEAILNALLDKKVGAACSHIRGLKDVKTLRLFANPNYSNDKETDGELPAKFSCPITKMEFNGNHPFVAIWTTGFVLSEKAIKELGIEALQGEYGPFTADDIIKLIPVGGEVEAQVAKMVERRNRKKAEKASKKAEHSTEQDGSAEPRKRKHKEDTKGGMEKSARVETSAGSSGSNGSGSSANVTSISKSNSLVKSANTAIKAQTESSSVFKGLFHKDHEKDKHDRDLFMSVAGIRYTLG